MDDLRLDHRYTVPAREIRVSVSRSSGPGGQHVNTTDTRIRLHYDLISTSAFPEVVRERLMQRLATRLTNTGSLVITCDSTRSQGRNLEEALERLRELLLEALIVRRARRATRPSKGAVRRRIEGKKKRSETKQGRRKPHRDD